MNMIASYWVHRLLNASWQGGLALSLLWLLCRCMPRMSPRVRCWLWRLAYLKMLLTLLGLSPLRLTLQLAPSLAGAFVSPATPDGVGPSRHAHRGISALPQRLFDLGASPTVLMTVWLIGTGIGGLHMGRQWRAARRLKRRCLPESDPRLLADYTLLCWQFGVSPPPALLQVEGGGSPLILGGIAPAVLLPAALRAACTPEELRLMLAHELAHLKRRDLWWCWLPALSQCLFFFHPLVRMANRQWHLAQEMACDELTLRVTRAGPGDYGEALLKAAAQSATSLRLGLAVVRPNDLQQSLSLRLSALMTRQSGMRLSLAAMALGAIALIPWQVVAAGPLAIPPAIAALQRAGSDEARQRWLSRALGLTASQQGRLRSLLMAADRRAERLHAASSFPAALRANLTRSLTDTTEAEAQAKLTPAQRRTLGDMGGMKVLYFALNPVKKPSK